MRPRAERQVPPRATLARHHRRRALGHALVHPRRRPSSTTAPTGASSSDGAPISSCASSVRNCEVVSCPATKRKNSAAVAASSPCASSTRRVAPVDEAAHTRSAAWRGPTIRASASCRSRLGRPQNSSRAARLKRLTSAAASTSNPSSSANAASGTSEETAASRSTASPARSRTAARSTARRVRPVSQGRSAATRGGAKASANAARIDSCVPVSLFAKVAGSRNRCRASSRSTVAGSGVTASNAFAGENRRPSRRTSFAVRCEATTTCPPSRNTAAPAGGCFHSSNSTRAAYLPRIREGPPR